MRINRTLIISAIVVALVFAGLFFAVAKSGSVGINVNVEAYGAVGDGITDDGPAILKALADAGASGTVFFPLGTYYMADVSTLPSGWPLANWIGEGDHTIAEFGQQSCIKYLTIEYGPTWDDAGNTMIPAGMQSTATHFRFILTPSAI